MQILKAIKRDMKRFVEKYIVALNFQFKLM